MAKKNLFINLVNSEMIHFNDRLDGKGQVANVSFSCDKSKTGIASVGLNPGQILDATRKDGTVIEGYNSVLLGAADAKRQVSICKKVATKTKAATYDTIEMTNAEILTAFLDGRKAYRESVKEADAE